MAIKFIIDSASDIVPAEAERLGLIHLPMVVRFGDKEYLDAVTLSHSEFYEKLIESDELPTTSQISPATYDDAITEALHTCDTVIIITVSSKLSGTYQSAVIAAQEHDGKVFVVDSESVCIGERLLILRALEMQSQGLSAEQIVEQLNEEKKHIRVMALVDTLEYLKKGGRISAATAFAGGLLSIKPVIAIENGEVAVIGKARGSKNANNLLRELVTKCGGINFDKPYALAYSGISDTLLQKYIEDSKEIWEHGTSSLPITTVGCSIGTHAGPGAVAVAFFETNN